MSSLTLKSLRLAFSLTTFLAALLALAGGCRRPDPPPSQGEAQQTVPKVTIVKPEKKTIRRDVSQPGHIEAFERTPIMARIPGYVLKWHVDIGDLVEKNSILAELSVPEMVSELKLKEEQVKQAEKLLELTKVQVVTARSQVQEAEAAHGRAQFTHDYWKGQSDRFSSLVKDSVLTKQSQEETLNQFRSAASTLAEAKAKVASARAMEQEKVVAQERAEVDIRAAKAAQQTQADLVGYATLKAPYDGVITQKTVNTQQFVQPAMGARGDVLYVVEKTDKARIFAAVPETDADWVRIGMAATFRVRGLPGKEFKHGINRTASSLDPVSRTLLTEIEVENPLKDAKQPKLGRWLQSGMYAYVTIDAEWPDVLTLPTSAVVTEGDVNVGYKTFCYIVGADGLVKRTQIEIGVRNDQLVEVLKKRVKHDDGFRWESFTQAEEVVGRDISGLKDGQLVEVSRLAK